MKKIAFILVLCALMVLSFSCKKDDNKTTTSSFTAKVEGTLWTGKTVMTIHLTGGNTTQILAAGSAPSEQISFFYKGSGTGTFELNDDNIASAVIGNYVFTSLFSSTPVGEIVVTKYDVANKKMSGTFKFEGEDIDGNVYNVTEGDFENIDLTVQ